MSSEVPVIWCPTWSTSPVWIPAHIWLPSVAAVVRRVWAHLIARPGASKAARTRQVQVVSWAASAALHLPDGPAAQRRDAYLARLPERMAWIHGYDVLGQAANDLATAPSRGSAAG